jgi:ankyrin repeat protein
MLLDKKADVNLKTVEGATPLHIACDIGHTDVVKMLLDNQADIHVLPDYKGRSPLDIAQACDDEGIVKLLLLPY